MLLAIDVGNTHTVFGLWDGARWKAIWRRSTNPAETEDQLARWVNGVHALSDLKLDVDAVSIASVVPQMDTHLAYLATKWLRVKPVFVRDGKAVGLPVDYDPPHAVGADRVATALAATAKYGSPAGVVDFGAATTFDTIDANGVYVGGAILPGVAIASQ